MFQFIINKTGANHRVALADVAKRRVECVRVCVILEMYSVLEGGFIIVNAEHIFRKICKKVLTVVILMLGRGMGRAFSISHFISFHKEAFLYYKCILSLYCKHC